MAIDTALYNKIYDATTVLTAGGLPVSGSVDANITNSNLNVAELNSSTILTKIQDLLTELKLKANLTDEQPVVDNRTISRLDDIILELQLKADLTETQPVKNVLGKDATTSSVASSTTSVTILVSNTNRRSVTIINNGTKKLYLKKGTGASLTDYTYFIAKNNGIEFDDYNGIITGVWDAVNGNALITEVTY